MKPAWIAFLVVVFVFLAASIFLPLYFLKWKKDSAKVSAGAEMEKMDSVVTIEFNDWMNFFMFNNSTTVETNADGVAFGRDMDYMLYTSKGIMAGRYLYDITNCPGSINYFSKKTNSPFMLFDQQIAVATEKQVVDAFGALLPGAIANTKVGLFLADDGLSIKAGKIVNGKLSLMRNANSIVNSWFVMGSSQFKLVSDFMNCVPNAYGPIVSRIRTDSNPNLQDTPVFRIVSTGASDGFYTYSDIIFFVRVPFTFRQYLSSLSDGTGSIANRGWFHYKHLVNSGALKNGWDIVDSANDIFKGSDSTQFGGGTQTFYALDRSDATVKFFVMNKTAKKPLPGDVWQGPHYGLWLVRASEPQTRLPYPGDIFDLDKIIGRLVNPDISVAPAVASAAAEQPAATTLIASAAQDLIQNLQVPAGTPTVYTVKIWPNGVVLFEPAKPIVQSTDEKGVTTIINQTTGITATQSTADGLVTSTNLNTGKVKVNRIGEAPTPEALTTIPKTSKDNTLLYIGIGVGGTIVIAIIFAFTFLYWKFGTMQIQNAFAAPAPAPAPSAYPPAPAAAYPPAAYPPAEVQALAPAAYPPAAYPPAPAEIQAFAPAPAEVQPQAPAPPPA